MLMMMIIGNPRLGPGRCIWVLLNPLGTYSSMSYSTGEENLVKVLPLWDIILEEVYTLGYFMVLYQLCYDGLCLAIYSYMRIAYHSILSLWGIEYV